MLTLSLSHSRLPPWKLIFLGCFLTSTLLYTFHGPTPASLTSSLSNVFRAPHRPLCSPRLWSAGQWRAIPPRAPPAVPVTSPADVLALDGFAGCASDREYNWHLAADADQFDRFPDVASYVWAPPEACDVRPLEAESFVRDLVEEGGWLLIGDSVTENHFFSLSCLLYPHVIATPNYTLNPYWDRAWPQHLYLNPSSPLLPHLHPPPGFDISLTPLVSFRRVDLLLTQDQLTDVYISSHPERARASDDGGDFKVFEGGDQVWEVQPTEYLAQFTAPLPEANYGTLVISTAGHWTVGTFPGLRNDSMPGQGIQNVVELFDEAMPVWAAMVEGWLRGDARSPSGGMTRGGRKRQVVVRAYLPGHDGCHDIMHPWETYEQANMSLPFNWGFITTYNDLFESILFSIQFPDIHFLPIDRPALLRPDAHAGGDCLHLISGTGVLEGWSHYIWHYVSREIGAS